MKPFFTFLISLFVFKNQLTAQCCQKSIAAFSVSIGNYKTGAVIAVEGYSWGIDRKAFFGGGVCTYNKTETYENVVDGKIETVEYKEPILDAYVLAGIKLAAHEEKYFITFSASAYLKGNLGANIGFYYKAGELILVGVQPGYQTKNGMGLSVKTIFRFN